jgi:hypothetical protein
MYVPTHVQIAQTDNCQHHDNEKEVGWNQRNEADPANRLLHQRHCCQQHQALVHIFFWGSVDE